MDMEMKIESEDKTLDQNEPNHNPLTFKAVLLKKYSSFHKISILSVMGIKTEKPPHLKVIFNFNLHTHAPQMTRPHLTMNVCDYDANSPGNKFDFCIGNLTRWRLDITPYKSFSEFLESLSQSRKKKYYQTQNAFQEYGATLSVIEGDWSQYAETVYDLYYNVAKKYGGVLYDLDFFHQIAKDPSYKLMCIWYQGSIVSALVMIDEEPVFHSMICCLDYNHSQKTRAYSLIHYEIIRMAIEAKKYTTVDIGMTGDRLKAIMGYKPVSVRMEVTAQNYFIKGMLRLLSRFFTATINSNGKLEMKFSWQRLTPG